MTLGPLMVDIAGTELCADDVRVLAHPLVGSVILFTRNYSNPRQAAALTAAIRAVRAPPLLIAVDQEAAACSAFERDSLGFRRHAYWADATTRIGEMRWSWRSRSAG